MSRPELSLVIVSYNTRDLLRQCLASIGEHCPSAEVIVVDNASRDGSAAMVAEEFPGARLIASPSNDGFAAANNLGLARASGEFVVLLNSDTVLEDDSLSRCAAWMRAEPRLGAASPLLVGVDGRPQECFHRMPSLAGMLRRALRRPTPPLDGDRDPAGWLAGTALMVRREALEAAGGRLDDAYFMYWEDADLSARLREAGWDLARFSGGHVLHYGGASGGGDDANRRGDLYAWSCYGKYRWFARHRGAGEALGLWLFDWVEVARKLARGLARPARRHELGQARILAGVLARRALGLAPPRPGAAGTAARRPAPTPAVAAALHDRGGP